MPCDGVAYNTIVEYTLPVPDYINPNVGAISVSANPAIINSSITASTNFIDPEETFDVPYTVEWDWGDGNIETPYLVNAPGLLSRNHIYASAGVYEIKLTVTDNVGEVGTSTFQYLSAYNPTSQGLFSAGQKFISPAGAYPQNPNATGNVVFGLSYKYQGDVPVGNRQFTMGFKNADFEFNATTISSLVISNGEGTLRGTGTITNRLGTYTFLVVGKEGTDTIRVQIKDTIGNTIYDTQPGAIDSADPTTVVTGNILAH